MPLVINSYITPHLPYLRSPLYYLTWTAYYLTYLLSPGLLTILQLICMLLEHLLPRVEYWVESEMRERLRRCEWAQEDWRKGGKGLRRIARERMGGNVGVGETTGWVLGASRWVGGMFGTGGAGGVKGTNQIVTSPRPLASPIRPASHPLSTFPLKPLSPRSTTSQSPFPSATSAFDRRGTGMQRGEGSVAYSQVSNRSTNPFRDGLRERQFRGVGGSGGDRRLPHLQHGRSGAHAPNIEYEDDRGSVWSGSEWRAT